jgi:hypothetical protein
MKNDVTVLVTTIRSTILQHPLPAWPGGWPGESEAAVIDAVCSIQARYGGPTTGVRRHVHDWRQADPRDTIDDLHQLTAFSQWNATRARPLRSKVSGQLKADVIANVAERLAAAGLVHAEDLLRDQRAEAIWSGTPGLGYTTWRYVLLLLGTDTVKPDTMLTRYVSRAVGHAATPEQVTAMVTAAADELKMPAHLLDHAIWSHERRRRATPDPT